MPRRGVQGWFTGLVVALVLLLTAGAASGRGFTTGFDDPVFLTQDSTTRANWLERARHEDAGILRLDVLWAAVATSKPAHPRSASDPAYDFSSLDAAVEDAASRGFRILFTVYDAPAWAEGRHRRSYADPGTWKPDPTAFGDFAHALASRYSGKFVSSTGTLLPRVRYFEAWNEPNLSFFLTPQWHRKRPASTRRYVRLVNSLYANVKSVQKGARVVAGATSNTGGGPGTRLAMFPVYFLRHFLCVAGTHCRKPKFDVLSAHPITSNIAPHQRQRGARAHALRSGDIFLADFGKVRRILHQAERHHRIAGSHHPLWATEFWWFTNPPNPFGASWEKQARWINLALYLLWRQGADVALNYEIKDNPSFASGVYSASGVAKPSARAFRFPFVIHDGKKHRMNIWTKVPQSGTLAIQRQDKHRNWRMVKTVNVRRGQVVRTRVRASRSAKLRGRIGHATSFRSSASTETARPKRMQGRNLPAPQALAPYSERTR